MKPIQIETTSDNSISIQMVTPEINGIEQPQEVCILIEDSEGCHDVTMTCKQALSLCSQLITLTNEA